MKSFFLCIRRILFLAAVLVICSGFSLAGSGYLAYREVTSQESLAEKAEAIRAKADFTSYEELPETYINAVIAVEDQRFFSHNGIDLIAICRALVHDIQSGSFAEGGSTIPQQLAKNLYFSQEKTLSRKAAEIFVALELKREFTDEEILELYVNSIYFGDGHYTVASASEGYFGKSPSEMNDYECTLLAGVPNAPSRYAPTVNPSLAAKRQLVVVKRMEACGYFSADEAENIAETTAQIAYAN